MGGFGSGGHNRRRVSVESCARLDAGMIRGAGYFSEAPPTRPTAWAYASQGVDSVALAVAWLKPGAELAALIVLPPTRGGGVYSQRVPVSFSPCNYGHRRAWLHCPECKRRVFALFYYPHTIDPSGNDLHMLTCRHCRHLTYDARRARGFDRAQVRVMAIACKLRRRVGGVGSWAEPWDMLPAKPRGMHRRTYARIAAQFERAADEADAAFTDTLARHL